jgi:hypothetical protein
MGKKEKPLTQYSIPKTRRLFHVHLSSIRVLDVIRGFPFQELQVRKLVCLDRKS